MPILLIEAVVAEGESIDSSWTQQIADGVGRILGTLPGRTWVRMRVLPRSYYAENGVKVSPDVRPVFVSVLRSQIPAVDALRVESRKLTVEISQIMGRPEENVHVLYLPPATGRMSFGGTLVEEPRLQSEGTQI